jgi:hypothetical protein
LLLGAFACLWSAPLAAYLQSSAFGDYVRHLVQGSILVGAGLLTLTALLAAPDLPRLVPGPARIARLRLGLPVILPLMVFVGAATLSLAVFRGGAVVEDESAYLFEARTFAAGLLKAPALPPEAAGAFEHYLFQQGADGWYAVPAPGWPIVLALGVLAGLPLLVNPLLAAASVWLGHRVALRAAGRDEADLTAILMAGSPMLLIYAGSLMAQSLALALELGAFLLLLIARERASADRPAWGPALGAGLLLGWLFVTRQFDGMLLSLLAGLWALWIFGRRGLLAPVAALAVGGIAAASVLLAINWAMTGHALSTVQGLYLDQSWGPGRNVYGFGAKLGPPEGWGALDTWPGHTLREGVLNAWTSASYLNLDLFGWVWGSALLILAALLWGLRGRYNRAMLGLAAVVVLALVGYWYGDNYYIGPRYWYPAFPAFIALTVAGVAALARASGGQGTRLATVVVLGALFGALVFTPWRATTKFYERTQRHADVVAAGRAVVAQHGTDVVVLLPCFHAFEAAAIENDPLLSSGRPVYAQARSPAEDQALAKALGRKPVRAGTCPDG